MDNSAKSDTARMARAISDETELRVREIMAESHRAYMERKKLLIAEGKERILKSFEKNKASMLKLVKRQIGLVKKEFRAQIQDLTAEIADKIVGNVKEKLKDEPLNETLIKDCLKRVDRETSEITVFCHERDIEIVKYFCMPKEKFSISLLPVCGLGGIVIVADSGSSVWDNSYASRLEIFLEKRLDVVGKALKEVLQCGF